MTDLATVLVEAAWDLEGLGLVGLAAAFALVIIGWPVEQAIAWWDARHRAAPRRTPTSRVRPSAAFPRRDRRRP